MAEEDGDAHSSSARSGDEHEDRVDADADARDDSTVMPDPSAPAVNGHKPASSKSKDPSRPKRKKARRACYACQRAHLTCGDERPCDRCIKRGLQDQCADGMRKKAKYLHDAPNEALVPGLAHSYSHSNGNGNKTASNPNDSIKKEAEARTHRPSISQQTRPGPFATYPQPGSQSSVHQVLPDHNGYNPYGNQQSPISSHYNAQQSPMQAITNNLQQNVSAAATSQHGYPPSMFDSSDASLFNFDLAGMNFGNHYGALEFGMLGHMSLLGTNEQSMMGPRPHSSSNSFDTPGVASAGYQESPLGYHIHRDSTATDWSNGGMHMGAYGHHNGSGEPQAYAISVNPPRTSSISENSPGSTGPELISYDAAYLDAPMFPNPHQPTYNTHSPQLRNQAFPKSPQFRHSEAISKKLAHLPAPATGSKRQRDPSGIYKSVKKPYPYTSAFHALHAVLNRRFGPQKRLRIAQAMASIRPSLISLQRTLIDDDLIMMEICFQRQLWEMEDIVPACGTPTIAIRRTGEIAYVGEEFTVLTGWRKDVLLGKAPNLNINSRDSEASSTTASGSATGTSTRGVNTPRVQVDDKTSEAQTLPQRPQPVFLTELLDDDSAIQWFEDFARLAFADTKGSASARCKLLKYRTKDSLSSEKDGMSERRDNVGTATSKGLAPPSLHPSPEVAISSSRKSGTKGHNKSLSQSIQGSDKMSKLGDKEGKVDCVYCWQVKRDVFDLPMMIVMNFLPIVPST